MPLYAGSVLLSKGAGGNASDAVKSTVHRVRIIKIGFSPNAIMPRKARPA